MVGAGTMPRVGTWGIRAYDPRDEELWLRCRVLSFLHSCYYDDVLVAKPRYDCPSVELVAVDGGVVVGVLDVAVRNDLATVETIAVHPDHQAQGIATGLLDHALPRLRELGATDLDAWTREDKSALRWYAAQGFVETEYYIHVHAAGDEVTQTIGGLAVAGTFLHADAAGEDDLRARFDRVYRCRRLVRAVVLQA